MSRRISSSRPMTGSSLPSFAMAVRSTPYFSNAWKEPSAVGLAEQRQDQVLSIELVMAQTKQKLLNAHQRFTGFVSKTFERDQESNPPSAGQWPSLSQT